MPESKSGALPLGDSPAETLPSRRRRGGRALCSTVPLQDPIPKARNATKPAARNEALSRETGERMPCERCAPRGRRCPPAMRSPHVGPRPRVPRTPRTRTHPSPSFAPAATTRASAASARGHFGIPRRRHRLEIVSAVTLGKDVYFRRRRASCQFRRREDARGRHMRRRHRERKPCRRQRDRRQRSPMPRASAFSPPTKNGTSAPSVSASVASRVARTVEAPQPIEREQHARRIGAAAAQSGAQRDALVDARSPRRCASRSPLQRRALRGSRDRRRAARRRRRACARSRRRREASSVIVSREVDEREQRLEQCDSRRRAGRSRAGTG